MRIFNKPSSLFSVLCCLTALTIIAQLSFFIIHSHAVELFDNFIGSSIRDNVLQPAVLLPLLGFIVIQIIAYLLFIGFIWFISTSCAELWGFSAYRLGIFFWLLANVAIFTLNYHYFPDSFFAALVRYIPYREAALWMSIIILSLASFFTYYQVIRSKRHILLAVIYLTVLGLILLTGGVNYFFAQPRYQVLWGQAKPNVIVIGVDSLRPDFIGYFGKKAVSTPHIDQFLKTAVTFTDAYTPLARTFPAWVSILTGKYPKNSHARMNLENARLSLNNDTLAKRLQAAGYETIYATDEKRFSNITIDYGFDRVIGPEMGLNDFIIGGLSDSPLSNLMINLPLGRFLFPYNYANRAAAITYEPDKFLQLVKASLHNRPNKPLFLAIHFCVSHWPFTWAHDQQGQDFSISQRYQSSLEKADQQVGELLQVLQADGLLENSFIILLSDHGISIGLPGDRLIEEKHYQGPRKRLEWVPLNKLSTVSSSVLDLHKNYSINTAYGQGTDVLSMKQYRVLLAFKYVGSSLGVKPQKLDYRSTLLDIAPTILDMLQLPPLRGIDGISLKPEIQDHPVKNDRPFYLETGFSVSDLETDNIEVDKVIEHTIQFYQMDPRNGRLFVKPSAVRLMLKNKQRAVLVGPWLLAYCPASIRNKIVFEDHGLRSKNTILPAYYVLANLKTGDWTLGLDTEFAKKAPLAELLKKLKAFYGEEI